jgi:hypothetical protein
MKSTVNIRKVRRNFMGRNVTHGNIKGESSFSEKRLNGREGMSEHRESTIESASTFVFGTRTSEEEDDAFKSLTSFFFENSFFFERDKEVTEPPEK